MIGERVRLAREACLLTQQQLADASGLQQGKVSDLEAGRVLNPAPEDIRAIARATTFPENFFYRGPLPDLPDGHYRRLKRGTMKVAKQVRAQVRQIVELVAESERSLKLPPVAIEPVRDIADLNEVEGCAKDTRAALDLGSRDPIPNLTRAVERAGIVVVALPNEMEDHDGFSAWPDYGLGGRPIIAIARGHSGDRDRFTIAHELGHLILHSHRSGIEPKRAEDEANRFAGALLIPEEAAREAIRPPVTLNVLKAVKATFGTSIQMSARRAYDLELIGKDQWVSLIKQISARGWRQVEPIEVTPEKPLLISKIVDLLAGPGSTQDRAAKLSLPLFYYRALAS